ncbi:MAG: Protein tyrosine phosphatase [Desulfotomaculum sp. 46_296]|nr:MAG: Protein tyrosine phosphatase [Desulfotomaculum sp. 46_296]HAU31744.1 arsenate reductase [Desulfotomaculum sp.]
MAKKKVVFICRGNSCRSQMAEGFAKKLYGDQWEAHSAGTVPEGVNPNAVSVMDEVGIDISGNKSKVLDQALLNSADLVVALCDVQEGCFVLPPTIRYVHCPVEDPARFAGCENEMSVFRNVRDKIKELVGELLS